MTTQEYMGQRIKSLRESKKLSQSELAKQVGYKDKTAVAKVEAGKVDLPQSKIAAFSKALNTTISYLFSDPEIELVSNLNEKNNNMYESASSAITNNAIVHGNNATTLTVINDAKKQELSAQESELLRIFHELSVRKQTELLSFAYELEEKL